MTRPYTYSYMPVTAMPYTYTSMSSSTMTYTSLAPGYPVVQGPPVPPDTVPVIAAAQTYSNTPDEEVVIPDPFAGRFNSLDLDDGS